MNVCRCDVLTCAGEHMLPMGNMRAGSKRKEPERETLCELQLQAQLH